MARVLVVNHDLDVADQEVDELRRAGHTVDQCGGPTHGRTSCPVLQGLPCWQVEEADVLVYDAWAAGDGARELTEDLFARYPSKAVVLTSSGMELDWIAGATGPVISLPGTSRPGALTKAVEEALRAAERVNLAAV
jgi:hypothetical protein